MGISRRIKTKVKTKVRPIAKNVMSIWHLAASPWQQLADQRRLQAILALKRLKELILPEAISSGCKRLVLFSHFSPKGRLQRAMKRELLDLRQRGWQVLILTDQLEPIERQWCNEQQVGLLFRENEGRDFGAFQDGWLALHSRGLWAKCEQLILLNDSVFPVACLAESSWPRFLDGDCKAVIGFTDSYQNGYHLQSYALNIPKNVFNAPWWHKYWSSYPGWGGMKIAIRDGEIGLSQTCLKHGITLTPLHPVSRLRGQLASGELMQKLEGICSAKAAELIVATLLNTSTSAITFFSPTHYWAIPLLLDGHPFIKRWLLESNEEMCLDPLLVAGGQAELIDPEELVDYLRPPIIGFAS